MEQLVKSLVAHNTLITARLNTLESLMTRGGLDIGTIADPGPDDGLGGGTGGGIIPGIGPIADPAPFVLEGLSKVQLKSRLADVDFARKKLDSLEGLLKDALKNVG